MTKQLVVHQVDILVENSDDKGRGVDQREVASELNKLPVNLGREDRREGKGSGE